MGTLLEHYGNSLRLSISANVTLAARRAFAVEITATAGSLVVRLPDAQQYVPGIKIIQIYNPGATSFEIRDHAGGVLDGGLTCTQNDVFEFALFDASTSAGDWEWASHVQGAAAAPAATIFPTTLGGTDFNNEAWKFNFVANTWAQGATNAANSHISSAGSRISGQGVVGNGALPAAGDHDKYDPETWSNLATDQPIARSEATGSEVAGDDKCYYFGTSANGSPSVDRDRCDSFDLSGDTFTRVADTPTSVRRKAQSQCKGTDYYLMGGTDSSAGVHTAIANNDKYDSVGDTFTSKKAMTNARMAFASAKRAMFDEPIVYAGTQTSNLTIRTDTVEKYDPLGDTWALLNTYPNGDTTQHGGCHIAANQRNYIVGAVSGTDTDATYEHTVAGDSYTLKLPHGDASAFAREIMDSTLSLTN